MEQSNQLQEQEQEQPFIKGGISVYEAIVLRDQSEKKRNTAGENMWKAEQEYLKARKELKDAQYELDMQTARVKHWYADLLATTQRLIK